MKKRYLQVISAAIAVSVALAGCGSSPVATEKDAAQKPEEAALENAGDKADGDAKVEGAQNKANGVEDMVDPAVNEDVSEYAAEDTDSFAYKEVIPDHLPPEKFNTEEYDALEENGFVTVEKQPLSTFAADVDTGSYANFRRMLTDGYRMDDIPSGAIRIEEMVNYFDYTVDDDKISDGAFSVQYETGVCPWNEKNGLLMITVQANQKEVHDEGGNYVFLIDTSGSMSESNKIDLAVKAFKKFLNTLDSDDRVSIVTYAGDFNTLIEGAGADDIDDIEKALDTARDNCNMYGGGTNGSGGIEAAYECAEKNFIKGGNNRIIIASDGDMNLGLTSNSELVDLIKEKKETGVFLTTLGFGSGNYSDSNMESLADAGNGNYYYIDCMDEARRVLEDKSAQTTITVAKDVKLQAEFNPAIVSGYRLLGYENRTMSADDFTDDKKDGGEVGAGQQVTVLYELEYANGENKDSGLKYQSGRELTEAADSKEVCTVAIRYKDPSGDTSTEESYPVLKNDTEKNSEDFAFASAVVEASLIIKNSKYKADADLDKAMKRARDNAAGDKFREQFADLLDEL